MKINISYLTTRQQKRFRFHYRIKVAERANKESQIARAQALFDAMRDYDEALQSAENDYLNAAFDAAHDAGSGYVDVGIEEIVGNAGGEWSIRLPEVEYYNGLVTTYETELSTAMTQVVAMCGKDDNKTFLAWLSQWNAVSQIQDPTARANAEAAFAAAFTSFWGSYTGTSSSDPLSFSECGGMISSLVQDSQLEGSTVLANLQSTLVSLKTSIQPLVSTSYGSDRYQREQAVNTAIIALKAQNKATREAKEKEITQEYKNAENNLWSIFVNAVTGVNANYLTTVVAIEETHQVSLAEAKANFEQAMVPATVTYVNQTESHREQFQQAVDSSSQSWGGLNVTRKPREWIADQVRGFLQWETKIAEDATSYLTSNNPYAVGTVSFFGNLQQNAAGIGLSFVESEKTVEGIFVDGGEAIDVGKEHGVAVGVDHVIGLRQFAEAGYGVDIMTLDKVDPLDKIADGSGRFGSTAGMFAGISSSIRSWLNPQPVSVATAVTETMQKNMKTNVAAEVTQQTAKPLVNSEVVTPNYPQGYVTTFDTSLLTNESTKVFGNSNKFPFNPNELLSELPRDTKGKIFPNKTTRIRPEQHPLKPGEIFNPRHHGQHYHIEIRIDSSKSWNSKGNVIKITPPGYILGDGTGFLPGEYFP